MRLATWNVNSIRSRAERVAAWLERRDIDRVGLEDVQIGFPGQPSWGEDPDAEARAIGATCGGVRVWSLYVPNGRTLSDPHYQYKLEWLAALRETAAGWLAADPGAQVALVG